jgi:hypothetical protein
VKFAALWDMTSRVLVKMYRLNGGTHCLHQGRRVKRIFGISAGCISLAELQHLWTVWSIHRGSIFGTGLWIVLLNWSNTSLASG